ncbi:MAG: elongation factor 4 [Candidatus Dadabacteria bacterium]|jgi:GTP-binding protein LepA|nr:elongation factor 4 [Candidatus Dadabacteria bacterium]|tara:strand:- start:7471 stop:9270 length:1800 start_codon:yes stop_codon:yes gene_type:complete
MHHKKIRNFCIIAHIDHGKSTLADRILELTNTVSKRNMQSQFLDNLDIERERGITIKAQSVRITYKSKDGEEYIFNLIDTPGHVDFSYEVSRSLMACEGALLVVDATQGVEAQTLAHAFLAADMGLEIIPVINKIDLPASDPERVCEEIENAIGIDCSNALLTSAKTGEGVIEILEEIIKIVPSPNQPKVNDTRALIIDSWFDSYLGVVLLVRVFDGEINKSDSIKLMATDKIYEIRNIGVFNPVAKSVEKLSWGEVGFITASIKQISDAKVGDTVTTIKNDSKIALQGFKDIKPMVFCGLYPIDSNFYENLKESLEKISLNDSSIRYEPETSAALGFGFRCGFLGLLHMEIVKERLEREFNLALITTSPTVVYEVIKTNKETLKIDNPKLLPDKSQIDSIKEPYVNISLYTPKKYLGGLLDLCEKRRGIQKNINFISEDRAILEYELPMSEMIYDFYNKVKSITKGYCSMDYEPSELQESNLIKLDILINGEIVDALSIITHKDNAYYRGKEIAERLKEIIPRQLFEVAIQAAIGAKIIARETVKALRKDVTAKCYGGDVTRKRKLLEKQKEGKKRMKNVGSVEIPQEAFMAVLSAKE